MPNNPIPVTVTVNSSGTPVCTPEPVPVPASAGRDRILRFELQTGGYVFPNDGAVVVTDPGTQFPDRSSTLPPEHTTVLLLDRNTERGTFKYTVTVKRVSDGQLIELDPTIYNEP